jgi:hypothetical protein
MRALGSGSFVLALCFASRIAFGAPPAADAARPSVDAARPSVDAARPAADPAPPPPPPAPAPPPPPEPSPPTPTPAPEPAPSAPEQEPSAPPPPPTADPTQVPTSLDTTAPLDERRPATTLAASARAAPDQPTASRFARDYDAWPFTLEARFGFNARLGSSFDASADDEVLDVSYALGAYLAWRPEYAFGLELEHSGLGRVRALSAENYIDAEYSVTSAWLAARVVPWRSERMDLFLNLRIGLAMQHLDALGTRQESASITVPATSFSCAQWDGPGIGLGAALGLDYRLARHVAFVTRLDAAGERLSGDELGTCADGIGSVTTVSGTVGLAYDFDTLRK